MAGHSKWANIKHRKMAKDAKKGQAWGKYCRELMMAAKIGGADPAANFRLRTAIDKAKASGIPADTITKAIAKGSGQLQGDQLENLSYEGYGPGGVAIFIEAMTDNRNRTAGDIRSYFNKYNGNLGESGCVGWMFLEKGQVLVSAKGLTEDQLLEVALDAGAEDVQFDEEENVFQVLTEPNALNDVCTALQASQILVQSAEVTRVPQNTVEVTDPEMAKTLLKLLNAIEEQDDVQAVHANFEMEDELLASVQ